MLEANPTLTPNLVKGLLQYTATFTPGLSPLRQGAGFMNVAGALSLAAAYYSQSGEIGQLPAVNADPSGAVAATVVDRQVVARSKLTMPATWSKRLLWGNHMLTGGVIDPNGSAWRVGVTC